MSATRSLSPTKPRRELLLAGLLALVGLLAAAGAAADTCRPNTDDCGATMDCVNCGEGFRCATRPYECCYGKTCGGGMVCARCPGAGRCVVPPYECCYGTVCGEGMVCARCPGAGRCAVPPYECCYGEVCGDGMVCLVDAAGARCGFGPGTPGGQANPPGPGGNPGNPAGGAGGGPAAAGSCHSLLVQMETLSQRLDEAAASLSELEMRRLEEELSQAEAQFFRDCIGEEGLVVAEPGTEPPATPPGGEPEPPSGEPEPPSGEPEPPSGEPEPPLGPATGPGAPLPGPNTIVLRAVQADHVIRNHGVPQLPELSQRSASPSGSIPIGFRKSWDTGFANCQGSVSYQLPAEIHLQPGANGGYEGTLEARMSGSASFSYKGLGYARDVSVQLDAAASYGVDQIGDDGISSGWRLDRSGESTEDRGVLHEGTWSSRSLTHARSWPISLADGQQTKYLVVELTAEVSGGVYQPSQENLIRVWYRWIQPAAGD